MKYAVQNKSIGETTSNTPFFRKENNPLVTDTNNSSFFNKAANNTVQRCAECDEEKKNLQKKDKENEEEQVSLSPKADIQRKPGVNGQGIIQRSVTDPIPETDNQFYGHGAFMGAAPQLMADSKWNRILQALMPDVHTDATAALASGPNSPELILMFENNPVMAAYGMYQTRQMDLASQGGRSDRIKKMEAIEWDVFLPTSIVEKYNRASDDEERKKLEGEMVNEMIIAHGTSWQTIKENAPFGGWRQYENVRGTRKTDQGGVRAGAWMDLFGRALQLATDPNWERTAREFEDPNLHPRVDNPSDQSAHGTFENQRSFRDVITAYKALFGKETFSVLLDIKSRDATPNVLKGLVTELNRRGVHVYGVGSFKHSELAGLSGMTQIVDGVAYSGPREVKFFHFAGDLQQACLKNEIKENDTVMFNAGSLIDYDKFRRGPNKKKSYKIKTDVVDQLRVYKRHYGFNLGVYVQENDIDDRAATLITDLTNANPDIFNLGFAWGGLSGQAASDIEPSFWNATVGVYNQSKVGTHWDTDEPLPASPAPVGTGFVSYIRMRRRFHQSRVFPVSSGSVTVTIDSSWNKPGCAPSTFFVTLVQEIDWWPDDSQGTIGYAIGSARSAVWPGLDPGNYYLQFWFPTDHDPTCELYGDITVST